MKRCSTPYIIREIQIKSTMRCHHSPIRMAKIWSSDNTKYCQWSGTIGTLIHHWWECKLYRYFGRQFGGSLQNYTYSYHTTQQSHSLLFTQRSWKLCPHKNLHTVVYNSVIRNCQNLEVTKMSFSKWMDKLWYIQTKEYYSALKDMRYPSPEKIWMKLKCKLLRERSQCEEARYCMIPTYDTLEKAKLWRQ